MVIRSRLNSAATVAAALLALPVVHGCGSAVAGLFEAASGDSSEAPETELFVESVSPTGGALGVDREVPVLVQFTSDLDPSTVGPGSFDVSVEVGDESRPLSGRFLVDGSVVRFMPDLPWPLLADVEVSIGTGITTTAGRPLRTPFNSGFTTRDGSWVPVASPPTSGRCADLAHIEGVGAMLLVHDPNADVLSVWEYSVEQGTWVDSGPLIDAPVSAIAHIDRFSHTNAVTRRSLIVGSDQRVMLVSSASTSGGIEIRTSFRVAAGVWTPSEVVVPAQSSFPFIQVAGAWRNDEPNVAWFDGSLRARRHEFGLWQPTETIDATSIVSEFDFTNGPDGTLHAVWETSFGALHRTKAPTDDQWPTGFANSVRLSEQPASLQIHAFDDGSALVVGSVFFLQGGAGVESSFLFPGSPFWTSLGGSASLNPLLGGDGGFANLLVSVHPSGPAIAAMTLNVEGTLTLAANVFDPVLWQFGEIVAGPYPGAFGASLVSDVGCAIDRDGNGLAVMVDGFEERVVAIRFDAAADEWRSLGVVPLVGETGCTRYPRIADLERGGDMFAVFNVCGGSPIVPLMFR